MVVGDLGGDLHRRRTTGARVEQRPRRGSDAPRRGRAESPGRLGAAFLAAGQAAEAAQWFERALAVRPDCWCVQRIALPRARRFVVASGQGAARPASAPGADATATASTLNRPTGRNGMDEAMRGIEALRRRDEAASKAYDVKALAELWTLDAVALPPGGPVKRGPDLRRDLEKMAQAARDTEVLDYREVFEETLVFGDTAVEWGHIEGSERERSSGKVTTSRFHVMRILKRLEDGNWRVHRSIFAPAG